MTTTTTDAYAERRSQYMTPALDVFPAHLRARTGAGSRDREGGVAEGRPTPTARR